jgi:hypothetical protein
MFFSQVAAGLWVFSARDQYGNELFSDWNWQTLEDAMQTAYRMANAYEADALTAAPPATGQLPHPRARRRAAGR